MEPENLDYMHALADHYVKSGEPQKALPIAERMISTHPDNELGQQLKAFLQQQLDGESPDPR